MKALRKNLTSHIVAVRIVILAILVVYTLIANA
jgi:hypothetical protein